MKSSPTDLPGVILIEPDVHRDDRGFFVESYQQKRYDAGGVDQRFVQDNHSRSGHRTLRGLHAQLKQPQSKLVRVIEGEVFDVAVDIRRGSPHFGRFATALLSSDNFLQLYVPPGFAHGFCVTSEFAQFEYKCTDFYDAADEIAIAWNDPDIGIPWPESDPLLSGKDAAAPRLSEIQGLPRFTG